MTSKEGKKWGKVCGKYAGDDGNGESVLTGFGSSSGSSTEETADQQEFLAELTRQMAENMFREDENISSNSLPPDTNKKTTTHFYPNQNLQSKIYKHERKMKEYGHGSKSGGFHTTALQNGSGMRVVFLGKTGSKSGSSSSGTGVFIPHRISSGTGVFIPHGTNNLTTDQQARKKSGCSTALVPERVLLTLKQHFEKRNAGGDVKKRNGDEENQEDERLQRQQEKPNKSSVLENNNDYEELQLPQEWTY